MMTASPTLRPAFLIGAGIGAAVMLVSGQVASDTMSVVAWTLVVVGAYAALQSVIDTRVRSAMLRDFPALIAESEELVKRHTHPWCHSELGHDQCPNRAELSYATRRLADAFTESSGSFRWFSMCAHPSSAAKLNAACAELDAARTAIFAEESERAPL